jgi:hypothetical protein
VFANSVLGARTNRYGDFLDVCCALTGRAPYTGFHTDDGRLGSVVFEVAIPDALLDVDLTYPLIGHLIGRASGAATPILVGLDERADEDRLKALGAAAASSGSVGMFHAVGVTPEAPTLAVTRGRHLGRGPTIDEPALREAYLQLSARGGGLGAVTVGTPHMSSGEMTTLVRLAAGRRSQVPFFVNMGRHTLTVAESSGLVDELTAFGATIITDTCIYITPIMGEIEGHLMTNSAKVAYYAPSNLGVAVTLGSLSDCVESAVTGRLIVSDFAA